MTLIIVGAGLAGLLAGNMLARRNPMVIEAQQRLPNNHSAVLRFRSSVVGDTLGIPFKKVSMIKTALKWSNPVADALNYSAKNTGFYRSDRSISAGELITDDRFIAPPYLIHMMAHPLDIKFGETCDFRDEDAQFISTIPMPTLMKLLDYPGREAINFRWQPGVNYRAKVRDCDAYASLLVPHPSINISRISLTGDELIAEAPGLSAPEDAESEILMAANLLGIATDAVYDIHARQSDYAKILPIPEDERRDFLYWATDRFNIFSLGRFATWRPGLLMDDLVKDLRLIDGWLDRKNRYAAARHR